MASGFIQDHEIKFEIWIININQPYPNHSPTPSSAFLYLIISYIFHIKCHIMYILNEFLQAFPHIMLIIKPMQ